MARSCLAPRSVRQCTNFYGLRERPFDLTPNPKFLYLTAGHREALSNLQYGITGRKGITLLIGEAGTGKTTLVRAALEAVAGPSVRCVYLSNPVLSREEFYEFLAPKFGLSERAARIEGALPGGTRGDASSSGTAPGG